MQFLRFRPTAAVLPKGFSANKKTRAQRRQTRSGLALIVVLFAVALVSIVVLAYFNFALLNRNVSFSSAGNARANIIALSALDYVKGDLISEIQYGSTEDVDPNGSGVPIYYPNTNTTMLPWRMTASFATPNYTQLPPNLIKWSSGTVPQWTNTTAYGNVYGPLRGSTVSTTTPSVDGHFLTNTIWNKPVFGTNTTFATAATPQWVYMSRQGPLTPTVAAAGNIATLNNPASTNYVVGRYAYTVYDEGGLLDVAAAGYSPDAFTSDPTDVGRKGSQGFADLTQLGLTTAQVDGLVGWRNVTSASNAAAYLGYLTTNAPSTGFLTTATNDQAFVSRQDLIAYMTSQMNITPASASTNALMYLTTFSREKNAPSWGPEHDASDPNSTTFWTGSNTDVPYDNGSYAYATYRDPSGGISYAYHTQMNNTVQNNRFLPNVRVKTAFTRQSGEAATVGEPLIKNRFDLSKLSWIQTGGTPPTGVTAQEIYNYFGLIANIDTPGHVMWTYNHTYANVSSVPTSNGLAVDTDHIMTLDEVASLGSSTSTFTNAQAREPDFFELLQAGILRGSTGLLSGDPTQYNNGAQNATGGEFYRAQGNSGYAIVDGGVLYRPMTNSPSYPYPSYPVHAQPMYQIIQIGANMIDQVDADNFPTEIILNADHFYGIQNLPYISGIGDAALRIAPGAISSSPDAQITSTTTQYQAYVHHWLDFGLWNPHQNAQYPPSSGPTDIRVSAMEGQEYPFVVGLGHTPISGTTPVGGTDYMGRIFEWPGTPVSTAPGYTDGPAWIGLKLALYNNFPEPASINYTNSYTSDGVSVNMNDPGGRVLTALGWQRAGIYLGWSWSPDNPYKVPLNAAYTNGGAFGFTYKGWQTNSTAAPLVTPRPMGAQITGPLTIYLQYEDVNHAGTWHTYQELHKIIYANNTGVGDAWMETNDPGLVGWTNYYPTTTTGATSTVTVAQAVNSTTTAKNAASLTWNGGFQTNADTVVMNMFDPRTDRFNMWGLQNNGSQPRNNTAMMVTSTLPLVTEPGGGAPAGPHFENPTNTTDVHWGPVIQSWVDNVSVSPMKNYDYTSGGADPTSFYRDRDSIARVGDAAGWTNVIMPSDALTTDPKGASPIITGAQMQRPLHLNRPFRSVGELGYVFRDDPWKTLNFISANSADAGLLDLFYVGSTNGAYSTNPPPDFIAGKININSAVQNVVASGATTLNSPPLQALLSQTVRDYDTPAGKASTMDSSLSVAADIQNLSTNIVYFGKTNGPFNSIADLPSVYPQVTAATVPTPLYTGLKNTSEAMIRSLADSSGTRTWNLMIDIVAQSGKFTPNAGGLNNFTVDGEKHYWLHVAIDRFTGQIVDEQLEPVWE